MVSGWPAITFAVFICQLKQDRFQQSSQGPGMVSGWPAITDICCVYLPVEAGAV